MDLLHLIQGSINSLMNNVVVVGVGMLALTMYVHIHMLNLRLEGPLLNEYKSDDILLKSFKFI